MTHAIAGFPFLILSLTFSIAGAVAAQSASSRKDIPAIAKAANGVIVSIITSDKDGHPVAQGTGFLVSKDGRIVTNYHVIKDAGSAIVKFPDGAFYDVDGVVAFDKTRDLAIIKAHGQNFRVVTLGNSDRVQVGEEIVAIGSPLSLESTVSSGIVSGIRTIEEEGGKFLQVTAPISPGSSGGPLFNMAGEVVGITTLYLKGGENLNFAIPINDAKRLLSSDSHVQGFSVHDMADSEGDAKPPFDPNAPYATVPSPSASTSPARALYKQFYDAGKIDGRIPTFVCFDDDPKHSQDFFTLQEAVYDPTYAKAASDHLQNLLKKQDDSEAWETMRSIEASAPDVSFLTDDMLTMEGIFYGKETEEYLRGGGRVLLFAPYFKGVAPYIQMEYRRGADDASWTHTSPPPNDLVKTWKTFLQIDPTTRRYRMTGIIAFADGTSDYWDVGSGACEKVPARQPQ